MAVKKRDVCSLCNNEAVYFRRYSGERLCRRCFIRSIEKHVRRTISRYDMFKPNDRIAVAVSGGKDSVALLHMLHKIERGFPRSELVAVTVDEGISGYRAEAVEIARETCQKLGIEHLVVSFEKLYGHELDEIAEVAERRGELTPCSYCAVLRRKALNVAASEIEADKLTTAHNLDDEVQTMLLNLIHGDALRIARVEPVLEGDASKFVQRVKPLCGVPENEVAMYAFLRGIRFQTVICPYAKTSMRSDIRNMLNRLETKHPGTKFTIFRSFERIRPSLKEATARAELSDCRICGEPTVGEVCKPCQALLKLGLLKA